MSDDRNLLVQRLLAEVDIEVIKTEDRSFPGEQWMIVYISEDKLLAAQGMSRSLEASLNELVDTDISSSVVVFRAIEARIETPRNAEPRKGRLAGRDVDQLIQLLEARSRTSDALPSLKYMEDPRASLSAIDSARHQVIFGRRGVGKTALLLEAKRVAEKGGNATLWVNAHVLRTLSAEMAAVIVAQMVVEAILKQNPDSDSSVFERLRGVQEELEKIRSQQGGLGSRMPDLNSAIRSVLRQDIIKLFIYIDDFYLLDLDKQPAFLDAIAALLRDSNGWLKIASIERLTRTYEPSTRTGLEIPHDAIKVDLDVTLETPEATQRFLEAVLVNYTDAAGIRSPAWISKPEARARLVLASGGVPRDYLNLFAASLVVARQARSRALEVGREDVAVAAGQSAKIKKRDLEQDVVASNSQHLLAAIDRLSSIVKSAGYAFFRVDVAQKNSEGYELLALLVDLRFAHMVQASLSDQHVSGRRYEAYVLDLSEYSDVRLKRGLHVLDLDEGQWTLRLTGQAREKRSLTGSLFRDELRQSPIVNVGELTAFS